MLDLHVRKLTCKGDNEGGVGCRGDLLTSITVSLSIVPRNSLAKQGRALREKSILGDVGKLERLDRC